VAKVLIVEDDPDLQLLIKTWVEDAGHHVVLADDGQEAMHQIREDRVDVVILDLMMPVVDGWEVLARVQRFKGPAPAIIVVSAHPDLDRATKLGAVAGFRKPVRPDELLHALDQALDSASWPVTPPET